MSWFRKLLGHTAAESEEQRMAEALGAWQAGDHGVALDLWAPLAQAGVARAQSNMGAAFLQGQGVERDPDKAVAWLRRAADQGDAGAQRNLALCHYEGWGVPQDQDMLSWMKLVGGGCDQDYAGARLWAEKAAAQGSIAAMARLGDIFHNALGVERDPAQAARPHHWAAWAGSRSTPRA